LASSSLRALPGKFGIKFPPETAQKKSAKSSFTQDYAAALATAIQKRFLGRLARKKSPKISVLEAESSRRRNDSTSFLEKVIFSKIFAYHTPEPRYLTAMELKDPRPALIGSGVPEEKPRLHGHTTAGRGNWKAAKESCGGKRYSIMAASSSVVESHPHALTVPDVNLSVHPAPIDRPQGARPVASEKTAKAVGP
jgi:hypothetical protein